MTTRLPAGYRAAGVACGLKPSGNQDLAILVSDRPATAAGVFTTNRYEAAPLTVTRRHLRGSVRALVVNAGNANACTGVAGVDDAHRMTVLAASALGLASERAVLVNSTGVIGVPLDMDKIATGITAAAGALSEHGGDAFAQAIMTTDTRQKTASAPVADGSLVGFAKGAGMMAPAMATMLGFLVTDLALAPAFARNALRRAVAGSFNALNLDACMSTNDTVLLIANGAADARPLDAGDPRAPAFEEALSDICGSLARQIADDGEGMTKLVCVRVEGAADPREAKRAADSIASNVLLRCALNGADPYWGRVLAALGASGIRFAPDRVDVRMGGELLAEGGTLGPGDVEKARARLREREIEIVVDLHRGGASATVLTNDLSVEYVRFNTEYTT